MSSLSKTVMRLCVLVGAVRIYESITIRGFGRKINKLEHDVVYDQDLHFCSDGEPLFLTHPEYSTTVFFVDGFRIRPAVGMNADWLRSLHHDLKVNIVAPVVGLQSMPYWLRSKEWSYIEDVRQAIQVYDAYLAGREPGHRMIPLSFSYGSISALTIAAKREPAEVMLISPIPAQLAVPQQQIDRLPDWLREWARKALSAALNPDGIMQGRRCGWIQYVLPIYIRPGDPSGGWDVADRACREEVNARILNGQELRLRDLLEIYDGMKFIRTRLLSEISGRRITLLTGRKDSILSSETADLFASQLREANCEVEHLIYERSAHNLLLDCEADRVMADVAQRVERAKVGESKDSIDLIALESESSENGAMIGANGSQVLARSDQISDASIS